jgi:hypothetical protein
MALVESIPNEYFAVVLLGAMEIPALVGSYHGRVLGGQQPHAIYYVPPID